MPRSNNVDRAIAEHNELVAARTRVAALEAQLARYDWQPIETAPNDEPVLLYSPDRGMTNRARIEAGVYRNTVTGSCHPWATHWRELPKPPKATLARLEGR